MKWGFIIVTYLQILIGNLSLVNVSDLESSLWFLYYLLFKHLGIFDSTLSSIHWSSIVDWSLTLSSRSISSCSSLCLVLESASSVTLSTNLIVVLRVSLIGISSSIVLVLQYESIWVKYVLRMHKNIFVYSIYSHLALCLSRNGSKQGVDQTLPLLMTARLKINYLSFNIKISSSEIFIKWIFYDKWVREIELKETKIF